ncbi:(d)CMP kinase [Nannocystaceae bacterium ST9]
MPGLLIVIDGPAGAGKSTVAHRLADELGVALLDTGAIYRSLAWLARERGVDWDDERGLAGVAETLAIRFEPVPLERRAGGPNQRVWVEDHDVTEVIRTSAISEGASKVSRHPAVRAALLGLQRGIAADAVSRGGCVAEGRDMGTVVFPDAPHKFFLTAEARTRAERRHLELLAKGVAKGVAVASRDQVEAEMSVRDQRDSSREVAPLARAADALLIDSSELDIAGVVAQMRARIAANAPA